MALCTVYSRTNQGASERERAGHGRFVKAIHYPDESVGQSQAVIFDDKTEAQIGKPKIREQLRLVLRRDVACHREHISGTNLA